MAVDAAISSVRLDMTSQHKGGSDTRKNQFPPHATSPVIDAISRHFDFHAGAIAIAGDVLHGHTSSSCSVASN